MKYVLNFIESIQNVCSCFHVTSFPFYFQAYIHNLYNYANKKYEDDNLIYNISKVLKDKETVFYCCHCTGEDAYNKIKKNLKDKISRINKSLVTLNK